ncbi:MAG TPA: hypothetical protein VJ044_07005, partial [Candidatus Hodarchaeales archaeon]|nr:hypothetical protein [Candidatus Hodarchaeales archaeon]
QDHSRQSNEASHEDRWIIDLYNRNIREYISKTWTNIVKEGRSTNERIIEIRKRHFIQDIERYANIVWRQYHLEQLGRGSSLEKYWNSAYQNTLERWKNRAQFYHDIQKESHFAEFFFFEGWKGVEASWIWEEHLQKQFPDRLQPE